MSKKEFLIKVLDKVGDSWGLGKALLILLKNDELDNESIDKLVPIMEDSISKVEDEQEKKRIQKGIDAMKKMKELETQDSVVNKSRLGELENLIESI